MKTQSQKIQTQEHKLRTQQQHKNTIRTLRTQVNKIIYKEILHTREQASIESTSYSHFL